LASRYHGRRYEPCPLFSTNPVGLVSGFDHRLRLRGMKVDQGRDQSGVQGLVILLEALQRPDEGVDNLLPQFGIGGGQLFHGLGNTPARVQTGLLIGQESLPCRQRNRADGREKRRRVPAYPVVVFIDCQQLQKRLDSFCRLLLGEGSPGMQRRPDLLTVAWGEVQFLVRHLADELRNVLAAEPELTGISPSPAIWVTKGQKPVNGWLVGLHRHNPFWEKQVE
jgi:hypothetical protein